MPFVQALKDPAGVDLKQVDDVLASSPGFLVADCKCLYDALGRIDTSGLSLSEKLTSIEVLASRQRIRQLDVKTQLGPTTGRLSHEGQSSS